MPDPVLSLPVLFLTGIVAGIVNVLAGGGSSLCLPVLIFAGLDPVTANGTNRIAIAAQSVSAVGGFQKQRLNNFPVSLKLASTAVPGALIGAFLATRIDNDTFRYVLVAVLIGSAVALFAPQKHNPDGTASVHPLLLHPVMFLIGLYGGFIQVGVGIAFLAGMQRVTQLDLVRVNAHKMVITLLYTLPALAIFWWMGEVNWPLGLALAVGTTTGGWLGSQIAVRGGERWIKTLVAVVVVGMSLKLLLG